MGLTDKYKQVSVKQASMKQVKTKQVSTGISKFLERVASVAT